MKLDMELIRDILIWCEETLPDETQSYLTNEIKIKEYTTKQIKFHFHLLIESGYIDAIDASTAGSPFDSFPSYLTFEGYQFLEAVKSDTVWNGMKEAASNLGIQAIKIALPVLAQIMARSAGLIP